MIRASLIALALWAAPAAAQEVTPESIPRGQQDYHAAAAGAYRLDPAHSAVQARVPHMGFSVSVFRSAPFRASSTGTPTTRRKAGWKPRSRSPRS